MSDSGFFLLPTNKLYKKENIRRLKNFPAGFVGNFYRNFADNFDNFTGSDFYSRIAADADIPREDVQKYILATSDYARSIQTDINHYVTRDRISDVSFRQKLDPISKNILRRQNPLELILEDISTFDAENPIVGSLLREIDINKKQSDSDFIKSLPSQPDKEFEIKKRLDQLKGKSGFNNRKNNNNNNNNNSNAGGQDLFGPGAPPTLPTIDDFLDENPQPLPFQPPNTPLNTGVNLFPPNAGAVQPPNSNFNVENFTVPNITTRGIGNDIFGSQAATAIRENKTKTQADIDDFLYELLIIKCLTLSWAMVLFKL